MTSTRIIISISIILFALALNFFLGDPISESLLENTARNDPDLYMLNAKIQRYSEYGVLDYELSADKFTHFPLTNLTTLATPSLILLSKGSTPWKINAEHGRLMPKSPFREEVVELWNDVSAVKQESNGQVIHITTDSLDVFPDKNYAETSERVYIINNRVTTTAAGLRADFELKKFVFLSTDSYRVNTIYISSGHR
ncbi:MAG: LPS export ABC transporter periplasmic protein LptC [Candidatus Azotimanducaceae bacterium]|uniref:LPS export ABC transporter periplasmic protein LptC n=1 Tax=OM182 bacterium TaxID=2510334 RepID=A0A520S4W9_9GAMM|nr:LPS export ABC transporter periplasmic protein LptC [Gammaproteobacteria bacterium]OUV67555.1 MAG: LPS export ABC transporter periplasmic protein LptC [Gammaproteobacteria bacterium TMED133]RZO77528.1 MAG: LPS export ABC transporter periplasmic protein LptC [OM182 bacterium]